MGSFGWFQCASTFALGLLHRDLGLLLLAQASEITVLLMSAYVAFEAHVLVLAFRSFALGLWLDDSPRRQFLQLSYDR